VTQIAMMILGPRVAWIASVASVVGNGQVWVFAALCIHMCTILLPLIEAWRGDIVDRRNARLQAPPMRRNDKYGVSEFDSPERPDFERIIIEDPKLLREFRLFTVRDFSVERVLFFERYYRARAVAEQSTLNDPLGPGRAWREHYKKIYFDFLRPNAELLLKDVDPTTLLTVRKEFRAETFNAAVLDAAAEEVWGLMWRHTYPRFLKYWRRQVRADIGKQKRWGRRREGSRMGAAALGLPTPGRKLSQAVIRKASRAVGLGGNSASSKAAVLTVPGSTVPP